MSDLVERLRERPSRYASETEEQAKERRQQEREEAAARIEQLEAALRPLACTCDRAAVMNAAAPRLTARFGTPAPHWERNAHDPRGTDRGGYPARQDYGAKLLRGVGRADHRHRLR